MEGSNGALTLTTTEVAGLLSVHPSTVKRWCNEGDLVTDRTGGGHRRIHLEDALDAARARGIPTFLDPFEPYEGHVWLAVEEAVREGSFRRVHSLALGWLLRGRTQRLSWLFQELGRRSDLSFPRLCDDGIRGFMTRVGEDWREGRLRVGDEHLASQAVTEALLHLRMDGDVRSPRRATPGDTPPRALVGVMEGDQHHLGALCVRLVLERSGWHVHYLGPDVPVEDLASLQRSVGARLVCVSFSPPASAADVRRCIRILEEFHSPDHPYTLALGGGALADGGALPFEPGPLRDVRVFRDCAGFSEELRAGFAAKGPVPPTARAET